MIKLLDKSIADKIAAGEVVESPVSIVKELIENSIDAGSKSIVIEIKKGGKTYIRVTDDGSGIPKDEVLLAFFRHATSKISEAKDLDAIGTLGFRGEALSSISAVTRLEIITKTENSKTGLKVYMEAGEVVDKSLLGCPNGTTIVIKDLFYNTPARLKFLKNDGTETGKITDLVSKLAVAFPDISFRFISNGNIIFATDGRGNRGNTIAEVFGHGDFDNLTYATEIQSKGKVELYVSKPTISRSSKRNQIFFVNGRTVDSKVIEKAIEIAYKERLFEGRFPIAFIFIETDPSLLDVNVHPNKKLVRFDDEEFIINLVASCINKAITSYDAISQASEVIKEKDLTISHEPVRYDSVSTENKESYPQVEKPISYFENTKPVEREVQTEEQIDIKKLLSTRPREDKSTSLEEENSIIETAVSKPFNVDDLKVTGEIFNSYITAVDKNNFYLIDQHAAHERIFYEKFTNAYLSDEIISQPLVLPILFNVTPELYAIKDQWVRKLASMGFSLEDFGPLTIRANEIPDFMSISEAEDFVNSFIENIESKTDFNNDVIINKLITRSCKSAVKAHDKLSMEEMVYLIKDLANCRIPFSCPHGRPIFVRFSPYDLEKMFKRV